MKTRLPALPMLIALAMGPSAGAQSPALNQNALSNKDVLTLAKAGFNEEFIIDTIAVSRTRFDMSVNGLAELAKEGLTERLIRIMMAAGNAPPSESAAPGAAMPAAPVPESMMVDTAVAANPPKKSRVIVVRPSATRQAISSETPYYEWTSVFWGLWKRKVGVGGMPRTNQVVAPSLGGYYQQVRVPVPAPPPARSLQPYQQVATRYVVLQ